jgi:hypothetical protein
MATEKTEQIELLNAEFQKMDDEFAASGSKKLAGSTARVDDDGYCSFKWLGGPFDNIYVSLRSYPPATSSCVVRVDIAYSDKPTTYTNYTIQNGSYITINSAADITSVNVVFVSGDSLPTPSNLQVGVWKNY